MTKLIQIARQHSVFLLILTIGAGLRLWNIGWSLPDVYEEATPFLQGWQIWNWGQPGLDFNPHFFNYSALSFYFQFFVQWVHYWLGHIAGSYTDLSAFQQAYTDNPTTFILCARITTVMFDLGTILVLYLLGRHLSKSKENPSLQHSHNDSAWVSNNFLGFLASAFVAINPLLIKQSHLINVDTPLVFFTVLSLSLMYRMFFSPTRKLYVWIGISIGLATATKYTGALLIPIFLVTYFLKENTWEQVRHAFTSFTWFLPLVISLFVFSLINPYIIIDWNSFIRDFSFEQEHIAIGHLGVDSQSNGIIYYLFEVFPLYQGWFAAAVLVCSIFFIPISRKKEGVVILLFPLLYTIIISTWSMRVERYLLPALPILLLILSVAIVDVLPLIRTILTKRTVRFVISLSTVVLVFIMIYVPLGQTLAFQHQESLVDTRTVAKNWIIENVAPQSSIVTGPFGINFPKGRYGEFLIPFTPTGAENLFMFYQTKWFEDTELLIASDYDYGRFRQDTIRYRQNLSFYDSLHEHWTLVNEIKPDSLQKGPIFWFYIYEQPQCDSFPHDIIEKLALLEDSNRIKKFSENLAHLLFFKKKLEKSRQLMEFAYNYDPSNLNLLRELSWTLFNLNRYQDVLRYTSHSLQLKPDQAEIVTLEGSSLLRLNRFDEAEQRLQLALKMNEKNEMTYLDLELLYRLKRDIQNQIAVLQKYLQLFPEGSERNTLIRNRIAQLTQQD